MNKYRSVKALLTTESGILEMGELCFSVTPDGRVIDPVSEQVYIIEPSDTPIQGWGDFGAEQDDVAYLAIEGSYRPAAYVHKSDLVKKGVRLPEVSRK